MLNRIAFAAVACSCCVVASPNAAVAQVGNADVMLRVDRLENQIRQLTGQVEQLQYRNQQLESTLKRLQEDTEFRFQELGARGGPRVASPRPGTSPPIQPSVPGSGRRSDAFDPSHSPGAPGVPRTLGAMPSIIAAEEMPVAAEPPPAPGGRVAGAPLDLGSMSTAAAQPPTPVSRAPGAAVSSLGLPPRAPAAGYGTTAPPSQSPRDAYDLGYGYLLRKDYALAEDTFRDFLKRYPSDRLAAEAHYWLGESMFQRQNYRDAADAFLALSKKYEDSAKAPDSLLRLGQSLAALNEKELACATFGEVTRKYPHASLTVKQVVEREQKRVHC